MGKKFELLYANGVYFIFQATTQLRFLVCSIEIYAVRQEIKFTSIASLCDMLERKHTRGFSASIEHRDTITPVSRIYHAPRVAGHYEDENNTLGI